MKKIILAVAAFCITLSAYAIGDTIYLNSQTVTCNLYGKKTECLQYKFNPSDTAWKVYEGDIRGFRYNPGYLYTLNVRQLENPQQWGLVKVIRKTKSTVQQVPGKSLNNAIKPPAALVGRWNYSRLISTDGEVKFTNEFLQFDAIDMKVNGRASCNGFFGNYMIDSAKGEKAIRFQALGHTMMACENLAAENKLLNAMELVNNWTVTGNKLYLKRDDKTLIELTKTTPSISPNGGGKLVD